MLHFYLFCLFIAELYNYIYQEVNKPDRKEVFINNSIFFIRFSGVINL